ncbi:MAG: blue (type 1) copper domain protein [Acidimicrobiales bacterium]|nr:blue (type 1) copper domain protein [Acidimicrobiales bacterium]
MASLAVLLLIGAGCGKSGSTATTTTTPSSAATSGPAAASGSTIDIKDFLFSPKELKVKVGTTVKWTNDDNNTHTVTSTDGPATFDSKGLKSGASYSFTFAKPGTYAYMCDIHNYMKGTVTVS